jgi:hypothetical protein
MPLHRRKPVVTFHRQRWFHALLCAVVVLGSGFAIAEAQATTTPAVRTVQPGTFAGYAFDACTAPTSASMAAWKANSPYRAIGIYIGGNNRGCTQANLTSDWVRVQVAAGWHLIPLYVGPQASCTGATAKKNLINNSQAAAMGTSSANDAANQAKALGLISQSTIVYDMEAYTVGDAACKAGVLAFMGAWSARLHALGYLSGFYSSMGSGGADQVANYAAANYVRPDYIDFARWDSLATVTDAGIPAAYWAPHRRMKQYAGGHTETYGGVTINVDNNYVDFAPLPAAKLADFDHSGWPDVLARTASTGNLFLYPGNGTYVDNGGRTSISGGWKSMNALVRVGDLNRDGYDDVVARQASNGYLYFYPGKSNGKLGARKLLSKDFKKMREITAIGDLTGDGYPDLLAAQTGNHDLYLYPGKKGSKLGARKLIGKGGWNTMSELAGVADFNRDGHPDLVAKQTSTGKLFLYLGGKSKIGGKRQVATGFGGYRDVLGVGDFDRDGYTDVAAVQKSNGALVLFRGTGSTLRAGVRVATGFGGRSPLL